MNAILQAALRRRGGPSEHIGGGNAPWSAGHFGLDQVTAFRRAPADTQRAILDGCSEDVLCEAVGVERLGLTFTARMVLLARTIEERMTYSLFGADEALHLAAIERLLPAPDTGAAVADPFLRLLEDAIAGGTQPALALLVQVVLEGWGIVHYQTLARACRDPHVAATFSRIVADEALHHGAGRALLHHDALAAGDRQWAIDVLTPLLAMVQAGPQRVVRRLDASLGPLSHRERARVFEELDVEARTHRTLDLLRSFMRPAPAVVRALERRAAFVPFSPARCAAAMEVSS
jgi:hypothetical protein